MVDHFRMAVKGIIESEGKILLVRESENYEDGTNAGKWQIPGGRLEPGEDYRKALRREIKEETGLKAEIGEPVAVDEWRPEIKGEDWQIVGVFFNCKPVKVDVDLGEEHDSYQWIDPGEHEDVELIGNLHEIIEKYIDRNKHSS